MATYFFVTLLEKEQKIRERGKTLKLLSFLKALKDLNVFSGLSVSNALRAYNALIALKVLSVFNALRAYRVPAEELFKRVKLS